MLRITVGTICKLFSVCLQAPSGTESPYITVILFIGTVSSRKQICHPFFNFYSSNKCGVCVSPRMESIIVLVIFCSVLNYPKT